MSFHDFRDLLLHLPGLVEKSGEGAAFSALETALLGLHIRRQALSPDDDRREMGEFRGLLLPVIQQCTFCDHVFRKPLGYAGDYLSQEMIWFARTEGSERRYTGTTALGRLLSSLTFQMANCQANEARVRTLAHRVRAAGRRLLSVGCGSCLELWHQPGLADRELVLLDQDGGALARAREKIDPAIRNVRFEQQNILKFALRGAKDTRHAAFDFVYAFGPFDYFDQASAARLLRGLWSMVAPGGSLLVTNAHPGNPTRFWMEYGGDWFLRYKDAPAMRELAAGLPAVEQTDLSLDAQGVYQFLELKKAGVRMEATLPAPAARRM
ncbi:MAG: class I SAM-dependent methyltransferase [Opitutaceae bacterium]|nr:class I SAM-dependent methyltransferase [Opitutaceae bacterium]